MKCDVDGCEALAMRDGKCFLHSQVEGCQWRGCTLPPSSGALFCDKHRGNRCRASGCSNQAIGVEQGIQWCADHAPSVNLSLPPDYIANPPHYTQGSIQPIDYIRANGLNFCEGNVVKYVSRHRLKNGVEDLKKARQYLQWLIDDYEGIPRA